MKVKKAILYTYFSAIFISILYYFFNKYFFSFLSEKYHEMPIKLFQSLFYYLFVIIYMWIPGIIALIFAKKEKISLPIFKKLNKYHLYAVILPIAFTFFIIFVSMLFSRLDIAYLSFIFPQSFNIFQLPLFNYFLYVSFLLLILLLYGSTFNTFVALGQELMWRGYLLEKFKKLNFWHSSLIIGILWGIWHFPITILFSLASFRVLSLIWIIILAILSTPFYIYLRSKGKSILVTSIFHGIFNAIAPYSIMIFNQPNQFLVGSSGIAAFIVWAFINFFLYLMVQKKINA
jgi:uncharacterized protein